MAAVPLPGFVHESASEEMQASCLFPAVVDPPSWSSSPEYEASGGAVTRDTHEEERPEQSRDGRD